ncbi:MAG: hypothetical protein AAF547_06550 [Actinomycetota bacterium]
MGLFLDVIAVVAKSETEVGVGLMAYAERCDGIAERTDAVGPDCAGATEYPAGVLVTCPGSFHDADDAARFLSQALGCATLTISVHDGDLWSYVLFDRGHPRHRFSTIPDYFEDDDGGPRSTSGDAVELAAQLPNVPVERIERYLRPWTADDDGTRAYPEDEFTVGDVWQFTDFLRAIGLDWPDDGDGAAGRSYRLTTERRYYSD